MLERPVYIYHFTHIKDLPSILEEGSLESPNALLEKELGYTDIAYSSVQGRRAAKQVPCGPGGVVHDYVPFYFAPRSPMLFTISKGNVQSYVEGPEPLVYLVSPVQAISAARLPFVFTDGHSIVDFTNFYDDLAYLDQIDWALIRSPYWANTSDDTDRVRRRQAEFLVHEWCHWGMITEIGVSSREMKATVVPMLASSSHRPPVSVQRDWYFWGLSK